MDLDGLKAPQPNQEVKNLHPKIDQSLTILTLKWTACLPSFLVSEECINEFEIQG